jgi:hypothetical protein
MKRQRRVAKETPEDIGVAGQASSFTADIGLDIGQGVGSEVRQAAVLEVAPQKFHRVEVGGVGRKPDDVAAWMSGQPLAHAFVLMGAPAIPQEDEGPAHMAREMAEEAQDLGSPNVAARV